MEVNDHDYWSMRFSTDWMSFGGDAQTKTFARMILGNLPMRILREMATEPLQVVDYGCAQGECAAMIKNVFPNLVVRGVDFSAEAIRIANREHGECNFEVADITTASVPCDIAVCSNVLEHVKDPLSLVRRLTENASRYVILLVPFHEPENSGIVEHVQRFSLDSFDSKCGDFQLAFSKVIRPLHGCEKYWPYLQLLLVYAKGESSLGLVDAGDIAHATSQLNDMQSGFQDMVLDRLNRLEMQVGDSVSADKRRLESENARLLADMQRRESESAGLMSDVRRLESENARLLADVQRRESESAGLMSDVRRLESENARLLAENHRLEAEKISLSDEKNYYAERQFAFHRESERLDREKTKLEERLVRYELAEDAVLKYIRAFVTNNSARLVNAAKHIRLQLLSGGLRGKKDFITWFSAACKRANQPDARFNSFWDIYETTRKTFAVSRRADSTEKAGENQIADVPVKISSYGKFDVLFFSVIDYGFRYQRPQQIADYYARNGHRVFYFNVNFGVGEEVTVHQVHENLFEVTLNFKEQRNVYTFTFADVREALESQLNAVLRNYSILDAIAISEYPNWIDAVRYVKHTYAMTDVLDYLDDWDGFENTATPELVANTREILTLSDCVIASSQYLAGKAATLSRNVVLVRNGTEFSHFNKVFHNGSDTHKRQYKIGYYGAIAHWFDLGKIKALAEALPDVEIELIGAVSTDVSGVAKLPNVKFLGEKPYGDLPELIRDWEVCLIPFDTSTSLIKATNPVKFYEYLSAGKKIVATEIPEIEEFSGKYVLLANDNGRFVDHVKACLEGRDGLLPAIERARFARENDWQCRLKAIDAAVMKSIPRFSIVVLTYGQLDYTKLCLDSILKWTAYPNYELIVVDNASTDGTPAYLTELAAKYPQMRVILNEKNLGFAAGNNVGLRAATGDYLLLLNNDTMVSRGWLSRFLAHFRAHPECGAAGPVSNSIGNKAMVAVQYEDISGFLDESGMRSFDHAFAFSPEDKCLAMFCFAFPRTVMDKVGCISEEYGRGMFEDDDYCMAIKRAGWKLSILDDTLIHHFLSVSFDAWGTEEKLDLHKRNREIFERKWDTTWALHEMRPGIDWTTNAKTTLSFGRIVGQGRLIHESSRDDSSPFRDRNFDLGCFIDRRKREGGYAGVYVIPSVWWEIPIFQRAQQMALAFARRNYLVVYLEMPSEKYAAGAVRNPVPGVYVFTVSDFEQALEGLEGCIVSIYSTAFEICTSETRFPSREFAERNTLIYELIDHFDEKITGKKTKGLVDFYNRITESPLPIHFLASARTLQHDLEKKSGRRVLYVANGVDKAHYSKENIAAIASRVVMPECLRSKRPKIGYFGALAPWLDYKMLKEVMAANPEWEFVFIGPDYSGGMKQLPQGAKNCHLLGPIPYNDLPAYAACFDVAMLPFQRGTLARSTSPLKLFEYFALGKPVVVTPDMDECVVHKGVFVGDGAKGFSLAIANALRMSGNESFLKDMETLTDQNTWDSRVESVIGAL